MTYRFEEEISKFGLEFANKLSVANVSMTLVHDLLDEMSESSMEVLVYSKLNNT